MKIYVHKNTCIWMLIGKFFIVPQTMNAKSPLLSEEWKSNMFHIYKIDYLVTKWINMDPWLLKEVCHKGSHVVELHIDEISRVGKFIETESNLVIFWEHG